MQREVKAESTNLAKEVKMDQVKIDELREVCGTAPSSEVGLKTEVKIFPDGVDVTLEDTNRNPYKAMFCAATATWGDNEYEQKWDKTSTPNKLEVIKAVLTHNTLPLAREVVSFLFRVKGLPRWLFDYHAHTPFCTFMSIGCRDNNKSDADLVLLDYNVGSATHEINETTSSFQISALREAKEVYHYIIKGGNESWQSARAFLPQSYQHSYYFYQNLLSMGSMKFDITSDGGFNLKYFYVTSIKNAIAERFPLIGSYIKTILTDRDFKRIENYKLKTTDMILLEQK